MLTDRPDNLNIYLLYAPEDEALKGELEQHLSFLERQGAVDVWHEGKLWAGSDRASVRKELLAKSDVILLLISANFLDSSFYEEVAEDIQIALDRQKKGETRVIPVILRDCLWQLDVFQHLNPLPRGGHPIQSKYWENRDKAFLNIAKELHQIAQDIRQAAVRVREQILDAASPRSQAYRVAEPPPPSQVIDETAATIELDDRDKQAQQLISSLVYLLRHEDFEQGKASILPLLHPSVLARNGQLRPDFIRNNYSYARERVPRYIYPIRLVEKKLGGQKTVGALTRKDTGEEIIYQIAKAEDKGGMPAMIRVFFSNKYPNPKISGFSL